MCNCQKFAPVPYKGRIGYMNSSPDPSCPTCRIGAFSAGQALPPGGVQLLSQANQVGFLTSRPIPVSPAGQIAYQKSAPYPSSPVRTVPSAPMQGRSTAFNSPVRSAPMSGPVSGSPPQMPVSGAPPAFLQYAPPDVFRPVAPSPYSTLGYSGPSGLQTFRKIR